MKRLLRVVAFLFMTLPAQAQEEEPPYVDIDPPSDSIPEGSEIFEPPVYPAALGTPVSLSSPSESINFLASTNNLVSAPDLAGAVGPNHVMSMFNSGVRIFNRSGSNLVLQSLASWWTNRGSVANVFDPRVAYDPEAGRWIATASGDSAPRQTNAHLLFAVSQSSDPTGAWYFHKFKVDTNNVNWLDLPFLGFNRQWIAVSASMTKTTTGDEYKGERFYIFNKTNLYQGGTNCVVTNLTSTSQRAHVVPAVTLDADQSDLYFLTTYNSAQYVVAGVYVGNLRMYKMTGGPDTPSFSSFAKYQQTAPWGLKDYRTNSAPQTNTSQKVWTGDSKIQYVVCRNSSIWAVQTIHLPWDSPTHSAIQWWKIALTGAVEDTGKIEDSSLHFAFPSIAVNRFGDAIIGFTSFGPNQYPSAAYAFRGYSDVPKLFRNIVTFKAGQGIYYRHDTRGRNRWGDFSSSVIDPADDTSFWTLQEYSIPPANDGTNNGDGRWGISWAKIEPPLPANDNFVDAFQISGSEGSTNILRTARSTSESGEPVHFGLYTNSVWFKWTAPANGDVSFDILNGSGAEHSICVYTGTAVGSLTLITSNVYTVSFSATAGTSYKIAITRSSPFEELLSSFYLWWKQPTAPLVLSSPTDKNVVVNDPFTLLTEVIGSPTLHYQWRSNGVAISGATFSRYTNTSVQMSDAGAYTLVASNSYGQATSEVAHVTVYTNGTATFSALSYISNYLQVHISGVTTHAYVVQASTNLIDWESIYTNNASFNFSNLIQTDYIVRAFRAVY